jgi:tetratricopeptide (TPR) repeat protein
LDKPKIDRKSLKRPDAFVEKGRSTLDYLYIRRMQILPVVGAIAAVLIGIYAYMSLTTHKLSKAWEGFYGASKQADPQKWDALKKFYPTSAGNRAGYFAAVTLGDHYFDEAKKQALKGDAPKDTPTLAAQAAEWYGKAETFADLLPAERQLIEIDRGQALEIDKKFDEALGEYQKAADQGGDVKPYAQLQAARAAELKNDRAKAIEIYQKVAAESADSEFGKQAKNQLRLLKSPLFQGQSE